MFEKLTLTIFFILIFSSIGQMPTTASTFEEKQILIVFEEDVSQKEIADTIDSAGGTLVENYREVGVASIEVAQSSIAELEENTSVKYVEEDIKVKLKAQQEDWGISAVNIPVAWKTGFTGKGVKIAVIDSGVAPHSDLNIVGGVSTVAYTQSYTDDQGHGTHVAGIIGARNNTIGVKGVAYDSQLYAVKAFDQDGSAYLSDIIEGIDWSIANGIDIINLSAGTQTDSWAFRSVVDKAYANGLLIVAAAGNDAAGDGTGDTVDYPARYPNAIAVGAVDKNYARASFSSTGPAVEVSAPGVGIVSTYLGNAYAGMSGTSMAAPYVAGELALLIQAYPQLSNEEIRLMLLELTKDLGPGGRDPFFGYGLIQAEAFVEDRDTEPVNPVVRLVANKQSVTGMPQESIGVTVTAVYENGAVKNVTNESLWTAANSAVATVNDGIIRLTGFGSTTVTATFEGQSVIISVEVPEPAFNPIEQLKVDKDMLIGQPGEAIQVNATANYENGEVLNVTREATWSSANPSIATVKDGLVEIKSNGSTTIKMSFEGESVIIVVNSPAPQSKTAAFEDIAIGHWAYTEVNYLKEQDIITGYPDNTFRPTQTIRRDHVALLFSKILPLENRVEQVQFSDVPNSYFYYDEIMKTQRAGIFSGSNGKFRPTEELTRAQMSKILVEAFDLKGSSEHPFKDAGESHWANEYIDILYANGITTGSEGLYNPEAPVTRAQYAVFLYRALALN